MDITPERCAECRFDGEHYTLEDVRGSLRALKYRWEWTIEGVDPVIVATRPAATVWSPLEYAAHSADVVGSVGVLVHQLVTGVFDDADDFVVPFPTDAAPDDPPPAETIEEAVARLDENARRIDRKIAGLVKDERAWTKTMTLGERSIDALWGYRHAVHDAQHHLSDAGRGLVALGAGAPQQTGTVAGLFAGSGGVPKKAIDEAAIGYRGVEGDRQAARRHHGRVWQALCLWSGDVVDDLRDEGHPITPGAAGENISIRGIDWPSLRPGARLRLGEVLVEISSWSPPCTKNKGWFIDGNYTRMDHDKHPGFSRAYASVLQDGVVRAGDTVEVEPT